MIGGTTRRAAEDEPLKHPHEVLRRYRLLLVRGRSRPRALHARRRKGARGREALGNDDIRQSPNSGQQTEPANTNPTSNPLAAWRLMGMGSVYE